MARKRSKKRRKNTTSMPPASRRPESLAPPTADAKSDAPEPTSESVRPSSPSVPDAAPASSSEGSSPGDAKTSKSTPERKRASFFDAEDHPSPDAPSAKDDAAKQPPAEAPDEPGELEEQDPGAQGGDDDATDRVDGSPPDEAREPEEQGKEEPGKKERETKSKGGGAKDDALHDDFFRQGEEVEQQQMAALAKAVNEEKELEDTGAIRLARIRTDPGLLARRKKLRRLVAYVLAPAAIIAVIAGAKLINGSGDASARPDTSGASSLRPPIRVTTAPTDTAPAPATASVAVPGASAGLAEDSAADGGADAAGEAADAAPEAAAEAAVASGEASAEPVAAVPDGVDPKKASYVALNRGKWDEAAAMARAAQARDPEDATLYLYEGTALQEMGRRAEAKEVFKACLAKAKRGPIQECRVFAGP